MKRIYKIIISLCLILFISTGCSNKKISNGTDAAKILLANERLDSKVLKKDENIFNKGKEAFETIKRETRKYSKRVNQNQIKNSFKKEGTKYTWSDAPEYSNFISFFDSYAINIEHTAERGSSLIDSTKKNIRIVDKWIKVDQTEILLTVEENSETIFSRIEDQYEICRRYQNELGLNVFEMFIENTSTNARSRMTYIPGLRYEFTITQGEHMLVIVADKEKGYWDIMTTGGMVNEKNTHITFNNLVMKDEAIYETSFTITEEDIYYGGVKLVTEDAKSDILYYDHRRITLYTTGIVGLDNFYIYANDDEVYNLTQNDHRYPENPKKYKVFSVGEGNDIQYFTDNVNSPTAKFENGKELNAEDAFYDNQIMVSNLLVTPTGGIDFYGEINLTFQEEDFDSNFSNLIKLADDIGFSLKGGNEQIYNSLKYALKDSINFSKYYLWQGNNINSLKEFDDSLNKELQLIEEFFNLYNSKKDLEVISIRNQAKLESSMHFTNLLYNKKGNISNEGFNIKIEELNVKTKDTILFVNGENYKLELAVALLEDSVYKNIVPIASFDNSKVYNNEKEFEIEGSISATIPLLEEGEYVLVVYIATLEEGIRITKPIQLEGTITKDTISIDGIYNSIYSENNQIIVKSSKDININLILEGSYTYDSLYELMESYAYKHGLTTDDVLQFKEGSNWKDLSDRDNIIKGIYRLRYISDNKDAYVEVTLK